MMLPMRGACDGPDALSDEDCLKLLHEIEVPLASGSDVPTAYWAAGISDAT